MCVCVCVCVCVCIYKCHSVNKGNIARGVGNRQYNTEFTFMEKNSEKYYFAFFQNIPHQLNQPRIYNRFHFSRKIPLIY